MSFCKIKSGCLIGITFFSVIYGMDNKETTTEGDFNDVLVNISKVNGMIQDLIQNYKQLQKMTNSDISQSDYDEKKTGLSHEVIKDTKKRAARKDKPTRTTKQRGLSTVMIMSDEELGRGKDKRVKDKARKPKDKQNSKKGHVNDDNVEKTEVHSDYNPVTPEADTDTKSTFKKDRNPISKASQNQMASADDSVVKPRSKPANALTPSIPKYVVTITTMYPKIIGNLIETRQSTPSKNHLEPRLDYDSPSEIRKHSRRTKKKPEIIYLRSNKKSKQVSTHRSITKKTQTRDSESVWEVDDKVLKEEKRITVLRQAYGDACLRLVLRKCYRACKQVSRDICHGKRLCPKKFMAVFKKTALKGCDKEFGHNASVFLRANPTELKKGASVDPTREGYLAMACLPGERPKIKPRQKQILTRQKHATKDIKPQRRNKKHIVQLAKTEHSTKPDTSLLVLRDRYEEACSRESAKKCFRACKNAINAAIEAESKKSKKKDIMMKACKKRCSKAYHARGYSDSSSDDDSDDSSSDSRSKKKKKNKSGSW